MSNNCIDTIGFISGYGPLVGEAKYVNAFTDNITGTVDLYTAPTGKKGFVTNFYLLNSSSMTALPQIKISSTYYNLIAPAINSAAVNFGLGYVINSGETLAVNSLTNPGGRAWAQVLEIDNSVPIYTAINLSLSSGNNTLYTCPSGKTATLIDSVAGNFSIGTSAGRYVNSSGSNRNVIFYHVPNGGSPGTSNIFFSTTLPTNQSNFPSYPRPMVPGDSIVVNTDASGNQIAWVTYYEI